jgi:ABC-2 type transport system ATP-binding protein
MTTPPDTTPPAPRVHASGQGDSPGNQSPHGNTGASMPSTSTPAVVTPPPLAEFDGVTKWYGAVLGVNEISVAINPGITGLLGPNGAGKTTFLRLLTGQLQPALGTVSVCGLSAWSAAARRHVGFAPDNDAMYDELTGEQFVIQAAHRHGMSRGEAREHTARVLEEVGMADRARKHLKGFSKGMRQRIRLAQALVHSPDLLVVDEPLNGIDPVGRVELMDLFRRFRDAGHAVLVSSHILEEMNELAERVVFLSRGRLVAEGSLAEIRRLLGNQPLQLKLVCEPSRRVATELVQWPMVRSIQVVSSTTLQLEVLPPADFFAQFQQAVLAHPDWHILELETTDESAKAIFKYVMEASSRF